MEQLDVNGATMQYEVHGQGEPILLIHLSGLADGLATPLLGQPELASRYQLIHYYRRGYGGSSRGSQPLTAGVEAADAAALLRHLGVKTAHVVGHSYGGSIALQLAVDAPELVHSLALLEPAMPALPEAQERMGALFRPVLEAYRAGDKRKAIQSFNDATFGPGWEAIVEAAIPGATERMLQSVDTFIMGELKPVQEWKFGPAQAATIKQPVLAVAGKRTSPFMKAGRELLHSWLPQAEYYDPDTTHLLQLKDPQGMAHALADFFGRHPIADALRVDQKQAAARAAR